MRRCEKPTQAHVCDMIFSYRPRRCSRPTQARSTPRLTVNPCKQGAPCMGRILLLLEARQTLALPSSAIRKRYAGRRRGVGPTPSKQLVVLGIVLGRLLL